MEENKAKLAEREEKKMHEFSSTVSYSPSFSYYASGEFAAAAVKVSRESQMSYNNLADDKSAKVDSSVEDGDFEFETSPLHEDTFVHFPPFKKEVVFVVNKKKEDDFEAAADENISGKCLWSPLRCPAAGSKRSRLKKLLTRSHSDGVVLAPSASKSCYLKEFMRRSHSDGGDASKTSSPGPGTGVKGKKEKTALYKVGEGEKRRKSYLPYKQDLIGVFAGIRGFRR